jgi:type VI secretion system protein ImpG
VCAPTALEKPRSVQVDALWSQPALWSSATGPLAIVPQRRKPEQVSFGIVGSVRNPEPSLLASDPARSRDVLALRTQALLDRRSLAGLLALVGATGASPYRAQPRRIVAVNVTEAPDALRRSGGIRLVYRIEARPPAAEDAALALPFQRRVSELLDAWTEDAVDVRMVAPLAAGTVERSDSRLATS